MTLYLCGSVTPLPPLKRMYRPACPNSEPRLDSIQQNLDLEPGLSMKTLAMKIGARTQPFLSENLRQQVHIDRDRRVERRSETECARRSRNVVTNPERHAPDHEQHH